ncbi:hypothetical protein [Kaistella montana]|uniref:GNAT family N-acetyltransferase n=1 Tax=Kaistella montana TaxID=1849733 RepID=A0ABW5K6B6_9FLAO|nr:hypothetical protein [Kaistella montana]MCQ4034762.1 hypothetical protein [Kaistella montana]
MIKRLKYQEIDFGKYEECLLRSEQYKYSAEKPYLDITSKKKWELLVYKDYEAVMPIPYITKMGIKVVVNPKLCQQLGVFSKTDSAKINDLFLDYFEKKYRIWYYAFNDKNNFSKQLKQRKNFLIFPEKYENVQKKYSPKRKRKLRLDPEVLEESQVSVDVNFDEAKNFIENNIMGVDKKSDLADFIMIFEAFYQEGSLQFYAFYYQKKMINLIAMHISSKSVTLLGTFNDKNFVKLSGASILIDYAIKNHIETRIFDFEGSEIPSVEEFFRGFRPELKPYTVIQNSKKNLVKRIFFAR